MMTTTTFYTGLAAIVLGHLAVALVNCWMIHRDFNTDAKGESSPPEGVVDAESTTFSLDMAYETKEVTAT